MSEQRGNPPRRKPGRNRARRTNKPVDLWRPVPALPAATPIVPSSDPTMLLRSLGDVPLHGQGQAAEHYIAAVVERAAGLATALAAAAGLLAGPVDEDD
jgi:hypothetical protein